MLKYPLLPREGFDNVLGTAAAPTDDTDTIIEDCIADVLIEDANELGIGARIVVWGDDGTVEVILCNVLDDGDDFDACSMEGGDVTLHEEDDEFCWNSLAACKGLLPMFCKELMLSLF